MRPVIRAHAQEEPAAVRARRRRREERRVFVVAGVFLALAALSAGIWHLERSGLIAMAATETGARFLTQAAALHLTVQSVEVEGRNRVDSQAILDALHVGRGTPILDIDLNAARTRLEALPWVLAASVERQLPDTIHVRLVEREPLAVWQHQRRFDVIDRDGAVISGVKVDAFPSLLQVVGDGAPQATADLLDMLASEPSLRSHVTAATRVGGRRWDLQLDDGIDVALPETAPEAAWRELATLERKEHLLERDIKAVDLRLQDRLVLRLAPETAKSLLKKTKPARPDA